VQSSAHTNAHADESVELNPRCYTKCCGSSSKSDRGENLSDSLLLMSLSHFYTKKCNIDKIIPVINCSSDVSLRLLDWFVINYAKKKNIIITQPSGDGVGMKYFNVYLSYRAQLKAYSKQHFDPFRRRDRIDYYFEKDRCIQTTIGQLNFFRWVIQNDIMDYIVEHGEEIEADMIRSKKQVRRRGGGGAGNGDDDDDDDESKDAERETSGEWKNQEQQGGERKAIISRAPRSSSTSSLISNGSTRHPGSHVTNGDRNITETVYQDDYEVGNRVNHIIGTHIIRFD